MTSLPDWGSAWLDQLAGPVGFDAAVLARGGTSVQMSRVKSVEFEPGLVRSEIEGPAGSEVTTVGITSLAPNQWIQLVDSATEDPSLAAALLAGELPIELASLLLPAKGQVSCDCTCKNSDGLCQHGAAVCHRIAERLTIDPFAAMLLRGRDRASVLGDLRSSRAQRSGVEQLNFSGLARGIDQGVSAAEAWRKEPGPPVVAPPAPRRVGKLSKLAVPPPSGSGIEEAELAALVADGASRARSMLAGTGSSGLDLSVGADVVRRAVTGDVRQISEVTKLPEDELAVAARAWKVGGVDGFKVSRSSWEPEPDLLQPARDVLGSSAKVRDNTVVGDGIQLRLDERRFWWRFVADETLGWVLDSTGVHDPAELV